MRKNNLKQSFYCMTYKFKDISIWNDLKILQKKQLGILLHMYLYDLIFSS